MTFDLHTHTTASDGALSPSELIERARVAGVSVLAITDHDTLEGMHAAKRLLRNANEGLQLVSGIEISSQWGKHGIHILGLNFDADNPALKQFVLRQKSLRRERNEKILSRLEKQGIDGVRELLSRQDIAVAELGRPQIAAAMVQLGIVPSAKKAFKRFLGAGGSAAVALNWPSVEETVRVIDAAEGDAVLAHPLHYRLTGTKLRALLADFKQAGGAAIEVVSGGQNTAQIKQLAALATAFSLRASIGSDFHNDQSPWQTMGRLEDLPSVCEPVWAGWASEVSSASSC